MTYPGGGDRSGIRGTRARKGPKGATTKATPPKSRLRTMINESGSSREQGRWEGKSRSHRRYGHVAVEGRHGGDGREEGREGGQARII